jgi:hypothetical protein
VLAAVLMVLVEVVVEVVEITEYHSPLPLVF